LRAIRWVVIAGTRKLTHIMRPIALGKTKAARIPSAAESNPWPRHTGFEFKKPPIGIADADGPGTPSD
jgi:hypothetical protein